MKKWVAGLAVLFANMLFADSIVLRDSTVIQGRIIQVTKTGVEYDPEGERTYDVISRDRVYKVVYDDGREERVSFDIIHMNDGKLLEGSIFEVDQSQVMFVRRGSVEKTGIPREQIDTIDFGDGRQVTFSHENAVEAESEPVKRVPGFHRSFVRIAGIFGFGVPVSDIVEREKNVFRSNIPHFVNTFGFRDYAIDNAFLNYGVDLDLMLPAIEFEQSKAFDFTGIKIGIRGRYVYTVTYSSIFDEHDYGYRYYDSDLFFGRLMTYNVWGVGPVFNFIFSPRSNNFNFMINMYALYGQVITGRMTAVPALRDAGITYDKYSYYTRFSGYTIRTGFGPHFSLNRWVPITLGINATYSMMRIKMDHSLGAYLDANRVHYIHEWGAELSLGLHF